MNMQTLPTVTLIADSGAPNNCRRYRFSGGTLSPDWAASLRSGCEAWCEISIYGDSTYLSSYGGEVWPGAWPELFVSSSECGSPTTRVTPLCSALLRSARSESDGFGPGTLDVLLAAEAHDVRTVCDAIDSLTGGALSSWAECDDIVIPKCTLAALVRALRGGSQ